MRPNFVQRFETISSALVIAIAGLINTTISVNAQQKLPVCQPPKPGEYLLLVITPTAEYQKQLRSALPNEIPTTTCQYLTDTVTRIGGFNTIEYANRWARYINNIVGLSAIISTKPAEVTQQAATVPTVSYNPQPLGQGYAVLVDYYNRPELANSVQQVVGGNVGFASYGQRPYLLATHTTNQQQAYNTLQKLNERGFFAILVDSRKVVLLRSAVKVQ
ncbi:hypothetical protein IQ244_18675 [Nostoc sp. LEGE 06077]|uniref:hypothetical protein n=1 Tax=Nostoc sp. LEGE 06077 TaxID=915325 RepID=UPI0018810A8B|nr:hypothetical protein [Nostoc sp. LEGE 06077]MBE9208521.1 hypothetical protein [Nostoc sp. LEGE 06077]